MYMQIGRVLGCRMRVIALRVSAKRWETGRFARRLNQASQRVEANDDLKTDKRSCGDKENFTAL